MSNRYGYHSPKHDGMMDDTVHSYQVKSHSYKVTQLLCSMTLLYMHICLLSLENLKSIQSEGLS